MGAAGAADPAVREAAEVGRAAVAVRAYTSEEGRAAAREQAAVARATWPVADPALLAEEKVTS